MLKLYKKSFDNSHKVTQDMYEDLLIKVKKGDIDSFEKIILNYEKLFFNIAYRILGNYENAKDILQESLIKIYKNIDRCSDINYFKNWSCKIVTNTCIDFIRSTKKNNTISLDYELELDGTSLKDQLKSDSNFYPENVLISNENKSKILEALNALTQTYKIVIILRDIKGFSYEEIANITNSSLGTVKSRISRARALLKQILIDELELNKNNNV